MTQSSVLKQCNNEHQCSTRIALGPKIIYIAAISGFLQHVTKVLYIANRPLDPSGIIHGIIHSIILYKTKFSK